jgi:UPF0716 protein FxsA
MLRLLLLLTIVPAVELFLLLQIGSAIGPAPTFLMLLLTGVVGAWLAKREGLAVLRLVGSELERGLPPPVRVAEGALVVIGGLLLVTPGVVTDLAGVFLIFPPTRRWLAPRALRWVTGRVDLGALPAAAPEADDGVRPRGERVHRRPERRHTPFATPFDDLP